MTEDEFISKIEEKCPPSSPPPLGLEEFLELESKTGLRVPLLFRRIYTEVTNGGIAHLNRFEDIVNCYLSIIELHKFDDEEKPWPENQLPVADWG